VSQPFPRLEDLLSPPSRFLSFAFQRFYLYLSAAFTVFDTAATMDTTLTTRDETLASSSRPASKKLTKTVQHHKVIFNPPLVDNGIFYERSAFQQRPNPTGVLAPRFAKEEVNTQPANVAD
jgi:hypothetical protein